MICRQLSLASTIILLYIVLFIKAAHLVKIVLTSRPDERLGVRSICNNIAPGVCCLSAWDGATDARFDDLESNHIAATWGYGFNRRSGSVAEGCSGRVLDSRRGPGSWYWEMEGHLHWDIATMASGASYITLPKALPPDEKTSAWLKAEGMLGFVWGGGKWFGNSNAEKVCFGPLVSKSKLRRDVRSARKGELCARSPLRAVYADVVEVDGEVYRGNGTDNVIYVDSKGEKVNITELVHL